MTRRFWTDVAVAPVADGYGVELDGKPVHTPGRERLLLPTRRLADAVADEWRSVDATIDPRAMHLTGLANAAVERVAANPAGFAATLVRYAENDLLYYRADAPEPLAQRQAAAWNPLLAWAERRYEVEFVITTGLVHVAQPSATLARLAAAIDAFDAFALAALSPIVSITGTVIGGLALAEDAVDADTLWMAAHVDPDWQAELWGSDAEAERARAGDRRAFDAAARFLTLSRSRGPDQG